LTITNYLLPGYLGFYQDDISGLFSCKLLQSTRKKYEEEFKVAYNSFSETTIACYICYMHATLACQKY